MSKTYEEFLKEQQKLSAQQKNADIESANSLYDAQVESVNGAYEPEKKNIELVYSDAIDENNVQRIINERQIAESMANAGSTDSGLNRTQLTASQLSHSNNYAKLRRQEQAAFDELDRAIAQEISQIEQNRQSTLAGIESEYAANDRSAATSMFNKQQEEETARYKATLEAQSEATASAAEAAKAKATARTSLLGKLASYDYDDANKQSFIDDYAFNYGVDDDDYNILKGLGYDISGKYGYTYFDPNVDRVSEMKAAINKKVGFNLNTLGESLADREYFGSIVEDMIDEALDNNQITEQEAAELYTYYRLV